MVGIVKNLQKIRDIVTSSITTVMFWIPDTILAEQKVTMYEGIPNFWLFASGLYYISKSPLIYVSKWFEMYFFAL